MIMIYLTMSTPFPSAVLKIYRVPFQLSVVLDPEQRFSYSSFCQRPRAGHSTCILNIGQNWIYDAVGLRSQQYLIGGQISKFKLLS